MNRLFVYLCFLCTTNAVYSADRARQQEKFTAILYCRWANCHHSCLTAPLFNDHIKSHATTKGDDGLYKCRFTGCGRINFHNQKNLLAHLVHCHSKK